MALATHRKTHRPTPTLTPLPSSASAGARPRGLVPEPHIKLPTDLLGHKGVVDRVAISPDLRWVATAGEDNTLRLWPMPDLSKPPLHTLPRDELLPRLRALTNIRVEPDSASSKGWRLEVGPFSGWKTIPEW